MLREPHYAEHMGEQSRALLFARQLAAGDAPWFFLDGAAAPAGEERLSYVGAASELIVARRGEEYDFLLRLRELQQAKVTVRAEHAEHKPKHGGESKEARFTSGWVVVLSYEFGLGLLGVDYDDGAFGTADDSEELPTAYALRIDRVHSYPQPANVQTDTSRTREVRESASGESANPKAVWRSTAEAYEAKVGECQASIHRGDGYVLCLTDTAETTRSGPFPPLDLYERLRAAGPATRGGVVSMGDRAIVSMSPERFLSVHGGQITTRPIKGTRRRGETKALDDQLVTELAADPKERAENLMIVDLMRNDLSRVCEPGSVRVTRFLDVETHPSVHQMVSTIEGRLDPQRDVFDAIAACFPAGSMTGTPKESAARILAALEGSPRGLYSGCFGWIDDSGDAELAMTIRSAELRGGIHPGNHEDVRVLVGAGGGITADSVPNLEREERDLKARSLLAAL